MDYTPQQLMGGGGFKPRVRIGNWSEDLELEEAKFNYFLQQKQSGTLPSHVLKRKYDHHQKLVAITPLRVEEDQKHVVCFGDKVMLFNHSTKGFLSIDLDTKLHHLRDRFGVTTIEQGKPISRSVFIITRPNKQYNDMDKLYDENSEQGHILHYGQSFTLQCLPDLNAPLYLRSQSVSPNCSSPISNYQEVSVDFDLERDSIWTCQYIDPNFRVEYEGEPVRGNSPILLIHAMTHQCLGSTGGRKILNDFGKENEVYCKTLLNVHRVEEPQNVWSLVYNKPERRSLEIEIPNEE